MDGSSIVQPATPNTPTPSPNGSLRRVSWEGRNIADDATVAPTSLIGARISFDEIKKQEDTFEIASHKPRRWCCFGVFGRKEK